MVAWCLQHMFQNSHCSKELAATVLQPPAPNYQPTTTCKAWVLQRGSCEVWVLGKGSLGPSTGLAMAVELDPLDALDQTLICGNSRPGAYPYWCYIQCEECGVGWIWIEKLGKGEPWTLKCYQTWRQSFYFNGGW